MNYASLIDAILQGHVGDAVKWGEVIVACMMLAALRCYAAIIPMVVQANLP